MAAYSSTMEWHTTALLLCCLSATLFLTILGLLIVSSIHGGFTASTVLYQGQCSTAGHVSMGIHAIIAVASFVLTVSSDTFVRFVVAPATGRCPSGSRPARVSRRWRHFRPEFEVHFTAASVTVGCVAGKLCSRATLLPCFDLLDFEVDGLPTDYGRSGVRGW